MPTAVVFGGSGQLGLATAEQLLSAGWQVTVVTRSSPPPEVARLGAVLVDGSQKSRATVIAGLDGPVDAIFDPTGYTEADAQDLLNVRSRFGALVVLSSSSVYADADGRSLDEADETGFPQFAEPITEDAFTVAPGPQTYSTRKVAMERALLASEMPVSVLRPCAIYGVRATHPREWWFIKRALDGRRLIPVSFGGRSVFHTSTAQGIARLAAICMEQPAARVLNVADREALPVAGIAAAISGATGLALPLAPFEGPPVGPSQVGGTPWSTDLPFVLDLTRARGLGWEPDEYRDAVAGVCRWILEVAKQGDWRNQFTRFAKYGFDPFDYAAEDAVLARL